ncbi:MAG TPA: RNA polymerase sigma factor [Steroidobacteraceae bacterium]
MNRRRLIQKLWSEHSLALQAFFRRRPASQRDAADLTQEVYLRLLRAADEREIANPEAYLFTVARNLLSEHAVSQQREETHRAMHRDRFIAEELAVEAGLDEEIDHEAQVRLLRTAIRSLNAPQQAALVMAFRHDMSYAEIAKKLNVHRSMVGKYVFQALNACRKHLQREESK